MVADPSHVAPAASACRAAKSMTGEVHFLISDAIELLYNGAPDHGLRQLSKAHDLLVQVGQRLTEAVKQWPGQQV